MKSSYSITKRFTISSGTVLTTLLIIVFAAIFAFVSSQFNGLMNDQLASLEESNTRELKILEESYSQKGVLLSELIAKISPNAIASYDFTTLETIASEVLADPDVVKAQFVGAGNTFEISKEVESSDSLSGEIIPFELELVDLDYGEVVGKFVLEMDIYRLIHQRETLAKKLEEKRSNIEASNQNKKTILLTSFVLITIFLNVLISLTINIILRRVVTKPINKGIDLVTAIAEYGNISVNMSEQFVDIVKTKEIDHLEEAMAKLIETEQAVADLTSDMANGNWMKIPHTRSEDDVLNISFAAMIESVNQTLTGVRDMAKQVTLVSQQLSDSGQSLASGAVSQAESINEINQAVSTLAEQTGESEKKATDALNYAVNVNENAATGSSQMDELNNAMGDIKTSSEEIQKIIKTIDDIAFQTNLLALNAAVEAARAGQHGKGFAVVADEVRNLASRSAKAASETAELIEKSNDRVNNGLTIAEKTGASLKSIVEGVEVINNSLEEIASAASNQVKDIEGIKVTANVIDNITQQNSATAEETASMAVELSAQAVSLNEQLAEFQLKEPDVDMSTFSSVEHEQNLLDDVQIQPQVSNNYLEY